MNPSLFDRQSNRLKNYDYSQPGYYFITICTENRACLFGHIRYDKMIMNERGMVVYQCWNDIPIHFSHVVLDASIVMPNHFHGIAVISAGRGTACRAPTPQNKNPKKFGKPTPGSIPTIIRSFKSAVTKRINEIGKTPGTKWWQRNYWDHVIRNNTELNRIRRYIHQNPRQWTTNKLYGGPGDSLKGGIPHA